MFVVVVCFVVGYGAGADADADAIRIAIAVATNSLFGKFTCLQQVVTEQVNMGTN